MAGRAPATRSGRGDMKIAVSNLTSPFRSKLSGYQGDKQLSNRILVGKFTIEPGGEVL
jgi:hypothetical protein